TIVRGLRRALGGAKIAAVEVRREKMAQAPPHLDFTQALVGERIEGVERRAKYVLIELRSGRRLVTSLRMTGRLVIHAPGDREFPATYVVITLGDGRRLAFADVRTFGRMRLVEANERWDDALGIEPLGGAFTGERFGAILAGRRTPIKALLLDQRRVVGIGNIYACESLWLAEIRPSRPAGSLRGPARERLRAAIVDVLERAIEMRGTSVDDYVDAEGLKGGFQNALAVYGRNGEGCPRCGSPIRRTVILGRGTWWCGQCQR
ncbi:MAG TPA: bifunctional DNA-formamidopyrimidine glycosylase/DNA-(apurinic or apyrimidinic site) lyase, partial [Candidatus Dormibacteraeota bacterium]|nr:bifunctional DNA-formamidopyrimidine glycosylase/DNA-(apurinic or apyrimidinic site) lyase [Candidatus Dormibacteraeota bacterium]